MVRIGSSIFGSR